MQEIFVVGIGGFIGAVGRYLMSGIVDRFISSEFPWGTFIVNMIGCFMAGCVLYFVENKLVISEQMRLFLIIGLLGAFTTFATFSREILELLQKGQTWFAFANIFGSVVLGLIAVWVGYELLKRVGV